MKNLLLQFLILVCLSANSQNNYRIQSKLGLDLLEETNESDYNVKSFKVTYMTIEKVMQTKWLSGAKTDTRSKDEMNLICLDGYITKYDFNIKTGFYVFELSSNSGSTIKCYIPTYNIDKISEDPNIAVEDTRAMFDMVDSYESVLKNDYNNCKNGLLDLAMWNDLNIGTKYPIAEKNKVRVYGFLLLNSSNQAELQPMVKFSWKQPTIEQIKQRDGL